MQVLGFGSFPLLFWVDWLLTCWISIVFYLGLVVFDTTKEKLIVMAERKTLLLKDDDVSKYITLKKLNIKIIWLGHKPWKSFYQGNECWNIWQIPLAIKKINLMRTGWVRIQLLWDCCSIEWNLKLLLQLNFITLLRRFGTLLQNLFLIRVLFLKF